MKPSQVYRKAAELLAVEMEMFDGRYCCVAIANIEGGTWYRPGECNQYFQETFNPNAGNPNAGGYHWWGDDTDEAREQRTIALLLMSEIAKDSE